MNRIIKKVAVLGSGVMGSRIAAHFANIGVQVLLLIPRLALAPDWKVLDLPVTTVQQRSYAEITKASYRAAWEAITAGTREAAIA